MSAVPLHYIEFSLPVNRQLPTAKIGSKLPCYNSKMNYLHSLNEKQKEAVLATKGPVLIVAGAGAGKTKTLTHRILHLIVSGVSPERILAI